MIKVHRWSKEEAANTRGWAAVWVMVGPWDTDQGEAAPMRSLECQTKEPGFNWKQGRTSEKGVLRLAGENVFFSD